MKHTKGPWKLEIHNKNLKGDYQIWNQNTLVAVVNEAHEIELPSGTDLANAHLISACPEMLEALQGARAALTAELKRQPMHWGITNALNLVESAISRAKGV